MAQAEARHILVDTEELCEELKSKLLAALILLTLQKSILPAHQAPAVVTSALLDLAKWFLNLTKSYSARQ